MNKWIVGGCGLAMVLMLSGCASDTREVLINRTIDQFNKAANGIASIKGNVEKWEKEKNDTEKGKLLKNALDGVKSLGEIAQAGAVDRGSDSIQRIKQQSEGLEPVTKEQRDEYRQKFRDKLKSAVERLSKEQTALNEVIARAEAANASGAPLAGLKKELQKVQGEFEALTKPR